MRRPKIKDMTLIEEFRFRAFAKATGSTTLVEAHSHH
jgi:hypothetical protein